MLPKNWPEKFKYSPRSIGKDVDISILIHLFASDQPDDLEQVVACIERGRVHPHLEIRKITEELFYKGPKPHPLSGKKVFDGHYQHGVFANEKIEKGEILGEYVGEISILNLESFEAEKGSGYGWCLCWDDRILVSIDSKNIANELTFVNDFRGLKEAPNVCTQWTVHRGVSYFVYAALQEIEKGEELLIDYGAEWESMLKRSDKTITNS